MDQIILKYINQYHHGHIIQSCDLTVEMFTDYGLDYNSAEINQQYKVYVYSIMPIRINTTINVSKVIQDQK